MEMRPLDCARRGLSRFAGSSVPQRFNNVGEEIHRHADIGVANDEQVMPGKSIQFHELGNFCVGATRRTANDQLRVAGREFLLQFANDADNRVIRRVHAEQKLHTASVLLNEPAPQTILRGRLAAFERLEQSNGRGKRMGGQTLVQRKSPRHQPLPEQQRKAQQCKESKDRVQNHRARHDKGEKRYCYKDSGGAFSNIGRSRDFQACLNRAGEAGFKRTE